MGAVVTQCPLWGESVVFGHLLLLLWSFSLLGRYASQGWLLKAGPWTTLHFPPWPEYLTWGSCLIPVFWTSGLMSGLCSIFVVAIDKLGHIMLIQVHFLDAWSHTASGQQHGLPALWAGGAPSSSRPNLGVEQWLQLRGWKGADCLSGVPWLSVSLLTAFCWIVLGSVVWSLEY